VRATYCGRFSHGPLLSEVAAHQIFDCPDRRVPAVVIGGELNGLGVCRSLAAGGIPVWVVDTKRFNPALWSRHTRSVLTNTLHGRGFVDFLRDLQRRIGGRPFLIVTDEPALLTISEHRDELEALYRFHLPARDTVLMLHDKARFQESAVKRGWPVPNGVVMRDRADIPAMIASLGLPMILKPADKRYFHEGRAPRLVVADSYPGAVSAAERLLSLAGEVLVQEVIEGPDDEIYFCLFYRGRDGETIGMFTGRKLTSSPPGTGSTAFCTAATEESLERTTREILDQVGYFGFGGVEYKRDARDGRFLIIEPTVGRTDWQEEVATLAGVNIPLMAYRHELGLGSLPAGPIDKRVVWQVSWIERFRHGRKPIPSGSVVIDGLLRRDDPVPAFVHYPGNLVDIATRYLRSWFERSGREADNSEWRSHRAKI
jgi:predicted ATP-grasp superfamily ATP-dependent carboligase